MLALTIATFVCVGAGGCGSATGKADPRGRAMPLASGQTPEVLAERAAAKILGDVVLSPEAHRVADVPADVRKILLAPARTAVQTATRDAFWTTAESPTSLLAIVRHEVGTGEPKSSDTGSVRGRLTYWSEEFTLRTSAPALKGETLRIAISPLGVHRFAMLGEARVTWRVPRPSYSLVPTANSVTVTLVRRVFAVNGKARVLRSQTRIDKPVLVSALRAAVNRLPVTSAGSCISETDDAYVWLVFRADHTQEPLATVRVDPFDCGPPTWITTPRYHRRTYLEATAGVIPLVERVVGSRLRERF
jgi:hypothetical protein